MTKYKATRCELDGIKFASKSEMLRYCHLKTLQIIGEISDLRCHPSFVIKIEGIKICKVILDFTYYDQSGVEIYEDFKGVDNALSKLKRKLVEAAHGIKVHVIRKSSAEIPNHNA